jgi:hypothetical protein
MVKTTTTQGAHQKSVSQKHRPATGGNKNINARATRTGSPLGKVRGTMKKVLAGPGI